MHGNAALLSLLFMLSLATRVSRVGAFIVVVGNTRQASPAAAGFVVAQISPSTGRNSNTCNSARSRLQFFAAAASNNNNNYSDKVNGEDSEQKSKKNNQNRKQERPQTGWNHKLPSRESDFWKGPRDEKGEELAKLSESAQKKELRTGWLHNTNINNSKLAGGSASKGRSSSASSSANTRGGGESDGSAATTGGTTTTTTTVNMARRRLELAQLQQERNHRILGPPAFHACGQDRVIAVTEHLISVPLVRDNSNNNNSNDSSNNQQQRIDVYLTIVEKVDTEETRLFLKDIFTPARSRTLTGTRQRSAAAAAATRYVEHAALQTADSMVLFLQGGPGFGAPTPAVGLGFAETGGSGSWADAALHTHGYQRIVLMDQRGTGKSTPITKQTLERKFPDLFLLDSSDNNNNNNMEINCRSLDDDEIGTLAEKERVQKAVVKVTDFLAQFRADNIVQDAEYIREALMLQTLSEEDEDDSSRRAALPWGCSLGQSYGGFCQMTYLSQVEHPPRLMLFTGGIAPMLSDVTEVYGLLWDRVKERCLRYYDMYPGDVAAVKTIVQKLLLFEQQQPVGGVQRLPSGGRLTARRFLALGISLGGTPSSFASMHELIASAFVGGPFAAAEAMVNNNVADLEFTRAFLKQIDSQQSFDDHPIYFWLHESIYADGPERCPTNWAADRAYQSKLCASSDNNTASEFDYRRTSQLNSSDDQPTLFFGEHVFPWMSEDFAELNGVGLRAVANALASKSDWGPLYDADRMKTVLGDGRTRSAAAVYHEDMYVEFDACMKVTARDGPLGNCKLYVTNEYQHSGLRDRGGALFSKLHGMAKGGTRTPS